MYCCCCEARQQLLTSNDYFYKYTGARIHRVVIGILLADRECIPTAVSQAYNKQRGMDSSTTTLMHKCILYHLIDFWPIGSAQLLLCCNRTTSNMQMMPQQPHMCTDTPCSLKKTSGRYVVYRFCFNTRHQHSRSKGCLHIYIDKRIYRVPFSGSLVYSKMLCT